jgi:hypothetical protein
MPAPVYLSINEFPGDGVTTQYEFTFAGGYIDKSHVKAYVQDATGVITPVTVTLGMFVTDFTVDLGVSAPVGGLTRVYRETPRDVPLLNFTTGARLTADNLDLLARQTIFVAAEAFDAGAYAFVNDLLSTALTSAATALAAAAAAAASAEAVDLGALFDAVAASEGAGTLASEHAAASADAASAAVIARIAAESAAADAEVSMLLAVAGAAIYPDTATGLAAVAEGEYFAVPGVGSGALILYRAVGGVAVLQTELASTALTSTLAAALVLDQANPPYVWDVQDEFGRAAMGVGSDGTLHVTRAVGTASVEAPHVVATSTVTLPDTSVVSNSLSPYVFELTDALGRSALGVTADGTVEVGALTARTINGQVPVFGGSVVVPPSSVQPRYHAEINHVITYGQSLSVGQTGGAVLSTSQPYNALKFSGGVRAWDTAIGTRYASLQPLTETVDGLLGETPSAGTAQAAMQLLSANYGTPTTGTEYRLLLSAPGFGGQSIAQLSKPGTHYTKLMEDITAGYTLAQAGGYSYAVNAMTWTQGEADTNLGTAPATYKSSFAQLLADVSADAQAVTGQAHPVKAITYQVSSHLKYAADGAGGAENAPIGLAQLDLHTSGVTSLACPTYQFDYLGATNVHLTAESSKWLGAYYGKVYKRIVVEQQPWEPLRPMSVTRQGSIITVALEPEAGPVVIDITQVAPASNYGFQLRDASGAVLGINSVSVVGNNVKIVAAAPVPTGAQLRYAVDSADGLLGRLVGPRGNIRDSAPEVFDPSGINKPLHNWLVMFTAQL